MMKKNKFRYNLTIFGTRDGLAKTQEKINNNAVLKDCFGELNWQSDTKDGFAAVAHNIEPDLTVVPPGTTVEDELTAISAAISDAILFLSKYDKSLTIRWMFKFSQGECKITKMLEDG